MSDKMTTSNSLITFSITQAWAIFKEKFAFILGVGVITFLIQYIPGFLAELMGSSILSLFIGLVGMVLSLIVSMGGMWIMIKLARGENADFNDLFGKINRFFPYAVGNFVMGLIIVLGLILLVIPGIYFALKYAFVPMLLVDKDDLKAMDALKKSSEMTQGIKLELLGFYLVLFVINFVGALLFGLGLIITIPVSMLAGSILYNKVLAKSK